ncbi:M23 family metallopeptidase [Pontibacter sp. JAM-7]|uniref:M23 family metallopeptidase n=1 Tax=Pontibacter sp. JAM-7 TaxID=3366581 RepID=UPI003AF47703
MRNKLVITLTTVYGSRQYTLNQVARYLLLLFILLSALSFFVSNALLMATTEDLAILEEDHQELTENYEYLLGTQQLYKNELETLGSTLNVLKTERDELHEENQRVGELNETLDSSLYMLENLLGLNASESMTLERAEALKLAATERLFFLHNIPNGLPIQALRVSDKFGMRTHPVSHKRTMHNGIDFKANRGTPVYATADGVVDTAAYQKSSGYGKLIVLQHNFGFKTYYGHLDKIKVKSGEFVTKGQLIGLSGNTGRSTGPHLHYEVRYLYRALDPGPFLAWSITDFDSLFEKVKGVKWASLKEMYPLNQRRQPLL